MAGMAGMACGNVYSPDKVLNNHIAARYQLPVHMQKALKYLNVHLAPTASLAVTLQHLASDDYLQYYVLVSSEHDRKVNCKAYMSVILLLITSKLMQQAVDPMA